MEKRGLTICVVAVIVALASGSACLAEHTHIWIDQASGRNATDTNGTPDEPFKSITYALARADFLAWPEPWHMHIGPGVYDANSAKPGSEREIFPIEVRQDMIFEGGDCNDPNNRNVDPNTRIIDGQDLTLGLAPLLLGQNRTGLEIRNLTLRNMNHSEGNGGAVELVDCAGLIENCIIRDNSAQYGGGLWLSPRSTVVPFHFIGCSFVGNSGTSYNGGGFYVNGTLTGNVTGCSFSGNSANQYGGGFYVKGTLDGDVGGCSFSGNSANYYGGGFYVSSTLNGDVTGCSFGSNSANYYVGFRINTLNGNVIGCSFSDNSANYDGGGFSIHTLNGNVIGCSFSDNSAGRYGGGFRISGNLTGNISDCSFVENSALYRGAFQVSGKLTGSIKECQFDNGQSIASDEALQINGDFKGTLEACWFYNFPKNAIRLLNDSATEATIRSCLIVAPATLGEVSGWAIWTKQKTVITNNTMVGPGLGTPALPYRPSAIYIEFNTQAENGRIFNNIVVDTQCAIHVDAAVDMSTKYNCFDNVNEVVCQGETCLGNDCWWLEWNLSNFRNNYCNTDPQFVAGDLMYHIQETSPCVDTGDPNYVPELNEIDFDGEPRVAGPNVDRGADEYWGCLNRNAPEYDDWLYWGKPDCWCFPRQCRGDINGLQQGLFWVSLNDLAIFKNCINKLEPLPAGCECADLNHQKQGLFWVSLQDLAIMATYINKLPLFVPICDQPPVYTGPYNFWTSP